MKFSIESMIT